MFQRKDNGSVVAVVGRSVTRHFGVSGLSVLALGLVLCAGVSAQAETLEDYCSDDVVYLGKALFWDQQVGGGNGAQMACASCHYQAGADSHPLRVADAKNGVGVNGSTGVLAADFMALSETTQPDGSRMCDPEDMNVATGGFVGTGVQAPPSNDTRFEFNFWDGRARDVFDGVAPNGNNDGTLRMRDAGGNIVPASFSIDDASQASQATGPPNSHIEMAGAGRTFHEIGFKMVSRMQPLEMQKGDIADDFGPDDRYADLIDQAFGDSLGHFIGDEIIEGVTASCSVDGADPVPAEVTMTENNFSLFWGISVGCYMQSVESRGHVPKASKRQRKAFKKLRCRHCHFDDGNSAAHIFTGKNGRGMVATGVETTAAFGGATNDFVTDEPGSGESKSSHLFNLPLTGPYFHDGSATTLEEVVDFYVRGGNHCERSGAGDVDCDSQVRPLRAKRRQVKDVVALLERLVDDRVAEGSGPWSHPSIKLVLSDGSAIQMDSSDGALGIECSDNSHGPGLCYDR